MERMYSIRLLGSGVGCVIMRSGGVASVGELVYPTRGEARLQGLPKNLIGWEEGVTCEFCE